LRILGVETATPAYEYSTEELLGIFPGRLSEQVIGNIKNLGVRSRFLAFSPRDIFRAKSTVPVASICKAAAGRVFASTGVRPSSIDLLISTYDYSDLLAPGLSEVLVREIGLGPEIPSLNLHGMACSALPRCLEVARAWLQARPNSLILALVSGVNSGWFIGRIRKLGRVMSPREIRSKRWSKAWKERELQKWIAAIQAFLFGDGASAMIFANGSGRMEVGTVAHLTNLDRRDWEAGYIAEGGHDGFDLTSAMDEQLSDMGLTYARFILERILPQGAGEVKHWVIHTGSRKILDELTSGLGIRRELCMQSYQVLEGYGNLGGASLPLILKKLEEDSPNGRACALGFGWGFSAGGCTIDF